MRRKITHTFFIHKTFGKYFSKSMQKVQKVVIFGEYNDIIYIMYETVYQ